MPQVIPFSNGGHVVHKVPTPNGKGRASVWFGAAGNVVDVEYFSTVPAHQATPIRKNGPTWSAIVGTARAYLPRPTTTLTA